MKKPPKTIPILLKYVPLTRISEAIDNEDDFKTLLDRAMEDEKLRRVLWTLFSFKSGNTEERVTEEVRHSGHFMVPSC